MVDAVSRRDPQSYAFDQNELRNGSPFTLGLCRLVKLRKIVVSCLVEAIELHDNISRARLPLRREDSAQSRQN